VLAYSITVGYLYKWSWCSDPRGSQSAKAVALDSMLGKILESLEAECVEVEVKGKRRWVGTRRTGNLGEEPLEKVEETNLEDAAKNVVIDDDDKVGSEGCCRVNEGFDLEKRMLREKIDYLAVHLTERIIHVIEEMIVGKKRKAK